MQNSETLIALLRNDPTKVTFQQTLQVIDKEFDFQPTRFCNGAQLNEADQNNGSCKILAFAMLHELSFQETLYLFGEYYRIDVLENPLGNDHQNIRQFIDQGWNGVQFSTPPLTPKA